QSGGQRLPFGVNVHTAGEGDPVGQRAGSLGAGGDGGAHRRVRGHRLSERCGERQPLTHRQRAARRQVWVADQVVDLSQKGGVVRLLGYGAQGLKDLAALGRQQVGRLGGQPFGLDRSVPRGLPVAGVEQPFSDLQERLAAFQGGQVYAEDGGAAG